MSQRYNQIDLLSFDIRNSLFDIRYSIFDIKTEDRLKNGFSLLELLIVLVLIGLITGLIVPKLGGSLSSVQARTAVKKISAMLRYAGNQAVTEQKTRLVTFYIPSNKVVLEIAEQQEVEADWESEKTVPAAHGLRVYQLPEKIRLMEAITVRGESGDEKFQLFFYPSGGSSGGEILLKGKRKLPYRIRIDFITGIVDVVD